MTCACPLCGAPIASPLPVDALLSLPVSPLAKRCIEVLHRLYPNTISLDDLASIVYQHDSEAGPFDVHSSIAVTMHRANKILKLCGWRIGASAPGKRDDLALRPIQ